MNSLIFIAAGVAAKNHHHIYPLMKTVDGCLCRWDKGACIMQSVTNTAHTEICSFLCSDLGDQSECWEAPRLRELDSKGNLWPGWNHKGEVVGEHGKV